MKKLLFFLVVTVFILTGASSRQPELSPVLVEGMSCIARYESFLDGLESGKVNRVVLQMNSLMDAVGYTQEELAFTRDTDSLRGMTYRQRQPLVFWHYPEADYFDGERYYYSRSDSWFVDNRKRFASRLDRDFVGIPAEFQVDDDLIIRDEVYQNGDNYYGYLTTESPDGKLRRELQAQIDQDGSFTEIAVMITRPEMQGLRVYEQYCRIRYQEMNQTAQITPPKGFDPDKLVSVAAQ